VASPAQPPGSMRSTSPAARRKRVTRPQISPFATSTAVRTSSALLRKGPVVLIFYRGEWCRYCNLYLRTGTDSSTRLTPTLAPYFEAVGNDVAVHNCPGGWVLPAAATFVIGVDGAVPYTNVRGNSTELAEPADVLAVLGSVR
jgi:peroxiredoxin